ncbi:MAG: hypothetical protein H6716_23645 [Polyangiaceae bacterium]|nr:hypothetical protein [Polyangiaceae bacterium]
MHQTPCGPGGQRCTSVPLVSEPYRGFDQAPAVHGHGGDSSIALLVPHGARGTPVPSLLSLMAYVRDTRSAAENFGRLVVQRW